MTERNMMTECWSCKFRRNIPGNNHISCANPDPEMTGNEHGIRKGWFFYPIIYDPTWKTKDCANFEQVGMIQRKWYFTLSDNQGGPGCIEVSGDDYYHARQRMVAEKGTDWAFQYDLLDKIHELDRTILDSF